MKRAVIGCIVALGLVVGGGAGAAVAGEPTGKGAPLPGGRAHLQRGARDEARPDTLRRHEDGSVTVGGEKVDDPDQYKGDPIPGAQNASSACAFSGQDLPDAEENQPPEFNDDFVTDQHVQSYGRWVSHGFKDAVPSPGEACRGTVEFEG